MRSGWRVVVMDATGAWAAQVAPTRLTIRAIAVRCRKFMAVVSQAVEAHGNVGKASLRRQLPMETLEFE
ncbi:hypothetical protein ASE52_17320 [Acidovorax sp. Root275]|nr:hypothetical protein ASE52_17320 [Acidovorax sp. Root275]